MKKWNLIVDVANCTNCNLCTLAVQDEHAGNAFPGYAEEMPKHGHRWIEIERRERGTPPVTDVAYLPTMCQHCDNAPCIRCRPRRHFQTRRRYRAHRSGQIQGPQGDRGFLPLWSHLVERGKAGAATLVLRRPSIGCRLGRAALRHRVRDQRTESGPGRGRGDATAGSPKKSWNR